MRAQPGPGSYTRISDFDQCKPLAKFNPIGKKKRLAFNADIGPASYNIKREITRNNNVSKTFGQATRTFLLQEGVERYDDNKVMSKEAIES